MKPLKQRALVVRGKASKGGKKKHKNRAEAVRVKVVRLDRGMNCDCEKEEKKN